MSYLLNRNGNWHFRIRIPSDLQHLTASPEIVKSLKTRDKKTAKVSALPYQTVTSSTFALFRSGFITVDEARRRLDDLLDRKPKPTVAPGSAVVVHPQTLTSSPRLSTVANQFINDRRLSWGKKTYLEMESTFKLTKEILGDRMVSEVDRSMIRDLRDSLCRLPSNVSKIFPDKTAREVLGMVADDRLPKAASPMSITTVNKHISRFSTLMKHCLKEGLITTNPAVGLKIKQKRKPDEERSAYSLEDIRRLTTSLPKDSKRPERYWVPMIGVFSGLRLDEICQMYTEDVREVDGVWCFDVNDTKDKKLKTLSSTRIVPVHPKLIELGLLDHLTRTEEQGHPRIWMNLNRRESDGYSNALGKWFQRFNRKHITDDPLKTFHSLRHTFADTLKQLGCQESLISELMGHANDSITTGRYGKRYQPKVLLEAVSMICY
ncbi:site-specific integrase [Geomonas diazotrophica]|nr:site-specific integrase [Geomonas nitrogeniifigens]